MNFFFVKKMNNLPINNIFGSKNRIKNLTAYKFIWDYICRKVCRRKSTNQILFNIESKSRLLNQSMEVVNYVKLFHEFHFLKKLLLDDEQENKFNSLKPVKLSPNKRVISLNNMSEAKDKQSSINLRLNKLLEENK